jgi:hypothetical protein
MRKLMLSADRVLGKRNVPEIFRADAILYAIDLHNAGPRSPLERATDHKPNFATWTPFFAKGYAHQREPLRGDTGWAPKGIPRHAVLGPSPGYKDTQRVVLLLKGQYGPSVNRYKVTFEQSLPPFRARGSRSPASLASASDGAPVHISDTASADATGDCSNDSAAQPNAPAPPPPLLRSAFRQPTAPRGQPSPASVRLDSANIGATTRAAKLPLGYDRQLRPTRCHEDNSARGQLLFFRRSSDCREVCIGGAAVPG